MRPLAVMAGAAAIALGYVGAHAAELPMVWLDPVLGTWSLGARPSSVAMDFFGRAAWGGVLALGAALAVSRLAVTERRSRVAAVVCALLIAGSLGLEVSRLWSRVPVAEEFPPGYDPITGRVEVPGPTRLAGP